MAGLSFSSCCSGLGDIGREYNSICPADLSDRSEANRKFREARSDCKESKKNFKAKFLKNPCSLEAVKALGLHHKIEIIVRKCFKKLPKEAPFLSEVPETLKAAAIKFSCYREALKDGILVDFRVRLKSLTLLPKEERVIQFEILTSDVKSSCEYVVANIEGQAKEKAICWLKKMTKKAGKQL